MKSTPSSSARAVQLKDGLFLVTQKSSTDDMIAIWKKTHGQLRRATRVLPAEAGIDQVLLSLVPGQENNRDPNGCPPPRARQGSLK
ncbi:hypothetical protein [Legionella taurinensis]|uniref:hypothetical protein n=1 Tax=Legionella taurinensis TaxID=70611 RepID=UPI0010A9F4C5|nr:hypothetical protein [Legionella taurinensis]MDX1838334.1 hypothetical protein [Legionella taurinensis]